MAGDTPGSEARVTRTNRRSIVQTLRRPLGERGSARARVGRTWQGEVITSRSQQGFIIGSDLELCVDGIRIFELEPVEFESTLFEIYY